MKPRTIILVSVAAVLVVGAAGYYGFSSSAQQPSTPQVPQTMAVTKCDVKQTVTAPGALENISETQILMPVNGTLTQVMVRAGDSVSAGQVLAKLDDHSKADAQIALKDAREAYKKAYDYRQTLNGKIWIESVTFKTIGSNTFPVIHWHRGYADPETIRDADNDLALKKAKLDEAQVTLDHMELKAPFNGVVTEVDAAANQPYQANAILFKLIDPKALEVKANVTQEDYPLLTHGQSAEVFFDARPDVTAQGKVDRIIPKLVSGDSPTYDIIVSLNQVPDGLVEGMTADTNITIASRLNVLCLPRSLVHASGNNKAVVQVWNGTSTESRDVTVGLRGDSNVEIVSGLTEGEQVVVR
ncbi:MAG TPA: efflux RND transporter periplasmic adaptor subunit [Anaerolineales bacterium]|jgi:macrolide-specific efflux system membrane fusion protein|nr:efflux RND transporter periplasmic adaptor subunit [Anaerolineales bacterium]